MARARLSTSAEAALGVLRICPNMPADVLAATLGDGHVVSTQQLLRRLELQKRVQRHVVALPPLLGSGRVTVWSVRAPRDSDGRGQKRDFEGTPP